MHYPFAQKLSENTANRGRSRSQLLPGLFWLKKSQKMPFISTPSIDHMQKM
jgi:hypothetical protein